jgi:hypothetical protein
VFLLHVHEDEVLGWKEDDGIQNSGIEGSQGNVIVDEGKVMKFWKNYIRELNDQPKQPHNLEVKPAEEVDADEKGPYIFQSEVEKFIKDMKDKTPTGDEDAPGDVLKLLGAEGLGLMTQLINNIHET